MRYSGNARPASAGRAAPALLAALGVALTAGVHAEAASATRVVRLVDIDIKPAVVTVRRGTTVEWRFLDAPAAHNVTSRGRTRFRSSATKQQGTHRVRFRRRGTYRYVCTLHPNMRGRVVVL